MANVTCTRDQTFYQSVDQYDDCKEIGLKKNQQIIEFMVCKIGIEENDWCPF
ncbi:hypothetical protein AAG906_010619 [Vitis piasezkii]